MLLAVDPDDIFIGFDLETGAPIDTCEVMDDAGLVIGVTEEATIGANKDCASVEAGMSADEQG